MVHRVAVIGQSNAILSTGFVGHLERSGEVELGSMRRLGASPSVLLPFFAQPGLFAGHDFAIFDLAVVDQGFLWANAIDPYSIVRWLEFGITEAHAAGCIPIVLVIPHKAALPAPASPSASRLPVPMLHLLYRSVAAHNDAVCVDLLAAAAQRTAAPGEGSHADADHLSNGFAADVARNLVDIMHAMSRDLPLRRQARGFLPRMERIRLAELLDCPVVRRESSLIDADYCRLEAGFSQKVDIGRTQRIVGLLHNRAASSGKLELAGNEAVVKQMGTVADSPNSHVAQIIPLVTPLSDRDGVLRLAVADARTAITEPSWQSRSTGDSLLELAELLVERDAVTFNYDRPMLSAAQRFPDWT